MLFLPALRAFAVDEDYEIAIKNHQFEPKELMVPSNKRVKILVHNQDPSAEEFESYELNREKVIPGGTKIAVFVGPLKPGRYEFFGDFHKDTAKGVLVAKD